MKKYLPLFILFISICFSRNLVNVNNLVKYGEKYYAENDDVPYDGIVFDMSKKTGNKTLQFVMVNGLKNGSYQEWYKDGISKIKGEYINDDSTGLWMCWHENGQKRFEKTYKNGERDGLFTYWYENGQKKSEKTYKDYEIIRIVRFHENGKKSLEGTYKDGKKDGKWTSWYLTGEISYYGYKNGEKDGLWTSWYENGQKQEEETYKNGELISSKCWDEGGNKSKCRDDWGDDW